MLAAAQDNMNPQQDILVKILEELRQKATSKLARLIDTLNEMTGAVKIATALPETITPADGADP